MALTTVTIVGSLYDSAGVKRTSGRLSIRPTAQIPVGSNLVAPKTVTVDVTGDLSFSLAPSNGVPYTVEYDPNPSDTTTPLPLKNGYFITSWLVPASGPVDISSL